MNTLSTDIVVVGGGIAGLWCAKELVDSGLNVALIEGSDSFANGATTRNEGWLHNGAYHSVGIDQEDDASSVTARTMYGHQKIYAFAPEAVEQGRSYALIKEPGLVGLATERWDKFGVSYRQVSSDVLAIEGLAVDRVSAIYETEDKSVDSRVICRMLAQYLTDRGANLFLKARFIPTDRGRGEVLTDSGRFKVSPTKFLVTAGVSTKRIFEEITGQSFPMRFFKSHLLVGPRLTNENFFYVDTWEPGIMSHGNSSIIGFNKDSVEVPEPTYEVIEGKAELIYSRLVEMLPRLAETPLYSPNIKKVACIKPDAADPERVKDRNARQDLNVSVYEPIEGYICAIPGKMTEAPALGRALMNYIATSTDLEITSVEPNDAFTENRVIDFPVTQRPADEWMAEMGFAS